MLTVYVYVAERAKGEGISIEAFNHFDLDTLLRARSNPLVQIWDGYAVAEGWEARADPGIRYGCDKDGKEATHTSDLIPAIWQPGKARLDAVATFVQQHGAVLDVQQNRLPVLTSDDAGNVEEFHLCGADGFVQRFALQSPSKVEADAQIEISARQCHRLVRADDGLLPLYRPGQGAWVAVIRGGSVVATIAALVTVAGRKALTPPSRAVELGLLPEVGADYR